MLTYLFNFLGLQPTGNGPQKRMFLAGANEVVEGVVVVGDDGNPLVRGSTGHDYTANPPAIPNIGQNFANAGPFANYVLVATVAANPSRVSIDIENMTGAQIAVVRDDGTAANNAAPVAASVFALAGGAAAGQQGGSWSSTTFRGRLQIFAPAALAGSAFVSIMED